MKLIIIYGPPAIGKLSVAKELSKLTGFKIFHNHLTVDLLLPIFEFESKSFTKLSSEFRIKIFKEAIKQDINLIHTFCYAHPDDLKYINKIKELCKQKGKLYFIQLTCNKSELFKRVKHDSRKNFHKIKKINQLNELFKKFDLLTTIPKSNSLIIDNSNLSPKKTARKIKEHYNL
jgi:tRNA uridine 5-carbamoylmethylation protein Kti12